MLIESIEMHTNLAKGSFDLYKYDCKLIWRGANGD